MGGLLNTLVQFNMDSLLISFDRFIFSNAIFAFNKSYRND